MKLLREFVERIQSVNLKTSQSEPQEEVQEGERVIGILSDDLKRIFVAMTVYGTEIESRCEKVHSCLEELKKKYADSNEKEMPDPTNDISLAQNHILDHRRGDFFADYFWICVKEAFVNTLLVDGNVGLRKGWKVVTWRDSAKVAREIRELADEFLKLAKE